MNSIGIIFDIDGVVTLPITEERKISIPDPDLFELIKILALQGVKINFITGRAFPWFEKFVLPILQKINIEYNCFLEYGLVSYNNKELHLSNEGKSFRSQYYDTFKQNILSEATKKDVFFEKDMVYVDYPNHGSLWIEEKLAMISVLTNKNISLPVVQDIVGNAVKEYLNEVRFLNHHLGCDILPHGWSKEQGALQVKNMTDEKVTEWYVFGDNEPDKEMCKPFSNVQYVDCKIGASDTTKQFLRKKFPEILD